MNNGLVFTTVLVTVGTTEFKKLVTNKGFAMSPILSGFILGIFLFMASAVNTKFAATLCALIMITAVLINGIAVFPALTSISGTKSSGDTGTGAPKHYTK